MRILIYSVLLLLMSCDFSTQKSNNIQVQIGKETVTYSASRGNSAQIEKLLQEYINAIGSVNKTQLSNVVSEAFIWYLHIGPLGTQGEKVQGVEEFFAVLKNRKNNWEQVSHTDNQIYVSNNTITYRYKLKGININSGPFFAYVVDILHYEGDKITQRDSYWKIQSLNLQPVEQVNCHEDCVRRIDQATFATQS